jgi:3-oxoacyl-[acyl-carrier-protein] synthase II
MIGHCLGAAGALETIAAIMAIERGIIHPTINYEFPDPECNVNVSAAAVERRVDRVIINNAGFGGHNGVLAIERFKG